MQLDVESVNYFGLRRVNASGRSGIYRTSFVNAIGSVHESASALQSTNQ